MTAADRGRHIRTEDAYGRLLGPGWHIRERRVLQGRLRIPYHHYFLRAGLAG